MENRIFISHSSLDKPIAEKIVSYLESYGYSCWIAPRDIATGLDYSDVINSAIENCSALVLVFSASAMQSPFVKKELTTAITLKKTILPFKISPVELSGGYLFLLNNVQWIDATSHTESKFPLLINGLQKRTPTPPPPPPPSPSSNPKLWLLLCAGGALVIGVVIWIILSKNSSYNPENTLPVDNPSAVESPTPQEDPATTSVTPENDKQEQPTTKKDDRNKRQNESTTKEEHSTPITPTPEETETEEPNNSTEVIISNPPESQPPQPPQPDPDITRKKRITTAEMYYNTGKYNSALKIYKDLKKDFPSDANLDEMIKKCEARIK